MHPKKPLYIYIMARGHSGSTMLELLLNRNTHIVAAGEIDMLGLQLFRDYKTRWEGLCSCGKRPLSCSVWSQVIGEIERNYKVNLKNAPFSWPISDIGIEEEYGWQKPIEQLRYRCNRMVRTAIHKFALTHTRLSNTYRSWAEHRDFLITTIAKQREALAVVDASKDPLQILDINSYSRLPFKVLFLTRDVRGNAWSAIKNARVKSVESEARAWARQNQRMLDYLDNLPEHIWTTVRYEDLCSNTNTELDRIFSFLSINNSDISPQLEFKKRHTIAGNKNRFQILEKIKEEKEWEKHLSRSQLKKISRHAGVVAKKLNYNI